MSNAEPFDFFINRREWEGRRFDLCSHKERLAEMRPEICFKACEVLGFFDARANIDVVASACQSVVQYCESETVSDHVVHKGRRMYS